MAHSLPISTESTVVNKVNDEKFVVVYTSDEEAAQLLDNGRTLVALKPFVYVSALGRHSYSSGIHQIRIRVDKRKPVLAIRSRNIPSIPDQHIGGRRRDSPSTYGWGVNFSAIFNGQNYWIEGPADEADGHIYTLTVNCDQHRLSLFNENTKKQYDVEVDIGHAPLPWCLFVEHGRFTGRLSLI